MKAKRSSNSKLIIFKKASSKKQLIPISSKDLNKNLLFYLKDEMNLPIASSCNGEGICKKCIFNEDKLLCSFEVKDIKEEVTIDYL